MGAVYHGRIRYVKLHDYKVRVGVKVTVRVRVRILINAGALITEFVSVRLALVIKIFISMARTDNSNHLTGRCVQNSLLSVQFGLVIKRSRRCHIILHS